MPAEQDTSAMRPQDNHDSEAKDALYITAVPEQANDVQQLINRLPKRLKYYVLAQRDRFGTPADQLDYCPFVYAADPTSPFQRIDGLNSLLELVCEFHQERTSPTLVAFHPFGKWLVGLEMRKRLEALLDDENAAPDSLSDPIVIPTATTLLAEYPILRTTTNTRSSTGAQDVLLSPTPGTVQEIPTPSTLADSHTSFEEQAVLLTRDHSPDSFEREAVLLSPVDPQPEAAVRLAAQNRRDPLRQECSSTQDQTDEIHKEQRQAARARREMESLVNPFSSTKSSEPQAGTEGLQQSASIHELSEIRKDLKALQQAITTQDVSDVRSRLATLEQSISTQEISHLRAELKKVQQSSSAQDLADMRTVLKALQQSLPVYTRAISSIGRELKQLETSLSGKYKWEWDDAELYRLDKTFESIQLDLSQNSQQCKASEEPQIQVLQGDAIQSTHRIETMQQTPALQADPQERMIWQLPDMSKLPKLLDGAIDILVWLNKMNDLFPPTAPCWYQRSLIRAITAHLFTSTPEYWWLTLTCEERVKSCESWKAFSLKIRKRFLPELETLKQIEENRRWNAERETVELYVLEKKLLAEAVSDTQDPTEFEICNSIWKGLPLDLTIPVSWVGSRKMSECFDDPIGRMMVEFKKALAKRQR
ncbi:unnamed protein product [Sympodiomycopsis kandeliae]